MKNMNNFENYDNGVVQALLLMTEDYLSLGEKEKLFELWKNELARGDQAVWRAFLDKVVEPILWLGGEGEDFLEEVAILAVQEPVILKNERFELLSEVCELHLLNGYTETAFNLVFVLYSEEIYNYLFSEDDITKEEMININQLLLWHEKWLKKINLALDIEEKYN